MEDNWYIKCGACPHLRVEHWPQGKTATRCASPESPWAPVERVLAVMPDFTSDPGNRTIRQRWCHDRTEKGELK